jgi:hypothetical protein
MVASTPIRTTQFPIEETGCEGRPGAISDTIAAARLGPTRVQVIGSGDAARRRVVTRVITGTTHLGLALASAAIDERSRLLAGERRARGDAEAASRLKDDLLPHCRMNCERH